jgi:hypothetical protein
VAAISIHANTTRPKGPRATLRVIEKSKVHMVVTANKLGFRVVAPAICYREGNVDR